MAGHGGAHNVGVRPLTFEKVKLVKELIAKGKTVPQACQIAGVSRVTYYRLR